tara:strand:- start:403 stop:804 length:402 start_codon:yes stop_codon:yes gene_type:complete
MRFSQYLKELAHAEMHYSQPIVAKEVPFDEIGTNQSQTEINNRLDRDLNDLLLSPESGLQRIRKVMASYGYEMPALYDADPDGDEVILDLEEDLSVYIIYYLTDDDNYEFYAEVGNESRMEELLSDGEDKEEE